MLYALLVYLAIGAGIVSYLWYREDFLMRGALLRVGVLLALFYPLWFLWMLVDRLQRRRRKPRIGQRSRQRTRKRTL